MNKYFYLKNNIQYGPYTIDQLRAKGISRETFVWRDGMDEWMQAGEVVEISEVLPPPIPMVTPPPTPNKGVASTLISEMFAYRNLGNTIFWLLIAMVIVLFIIRSL